MNNDYFDAGAKCGMALGKGGPIRFNADGSIHDDILSLSLVSTGVPPYLAPMAGTSRISDKSGTTKIESMNVHGRSRWRSMHASSIFRTKTGIFISP